MQLSAITYNFKKYLKFTKKHAKSGAGSLQDVRFALKVIILHILSFSKLPNFNVQLN